MALFALPLVPLPSLSLLLFGIRCWFDQTVCWEETWKGSSYVTIRAVFALSLDYCLCLWLLSVPRPSTGTSEGKETKPVQRSGV